eukprot:5698125-Amphidinium_carterae.1
MPLADSGWWSLTSHIVNKLNARASLQDLVVAITEDLEMPTPFKLHNALPPHHGPHDCQYCIQQSSETEWKLIRFFTFVRRSKLADIKSACGDCTRLKTTTTAKAILQTVFEGLSGSLLLSKTTQPVQKSRSPRQGPQGIRIHLSSDENFIGSRKLFTIRRLL